MVVASLVEVGTFIAPERENSVLAMVFCSIRERLCILIMRQRSDIDLLTSSMIQDTVLVMDEEGAQPDFGHTATAPRDEHAF